MDKVWPIIEIIVNIAESGIILSFLIQYFGFKENVKYPKIITSVLIVLWAGILTLFNHIILMEELSIALLIIVLFIMVKLFLNGRWIKQGFLCISLFMMITVINVAVIFVINHIAGVDLIEIVSLSSYARFVALIISKILLFYATKIILKLKQKQKDESISIVQWGILIIIPLFSAFTIMIMLQNSLSIERNFIMQFMSIIGIILINAAVYYFISIINKENKIKSEYSLLEQRLQYQQKYYKEIEKSDEAIRMVKHDLKNYIFGLNTLLIEEKYDELSDYLKKISVKITKSDSVIRTDNSTINSLINYKAAIMKDEQIKFCCNVKCSLADIKSFDLSILLGNLLDNSIEACEKVRGHEPEILLEISQKKLYLSINVKNSIQNSVLENNSDLKTTKEDKFTHGLGIKSIQKVVDQYYGMFDYNETNNMFCVNVLLFKQALEDEKC